MSIDNSRLFTVHVHELAIYLCLGDDKGEWEYDKGEWEYLQWWIFCNSPFLIPWPCKYPHLDVRVCEIVSTLH